MAEKRTVHVLLVFSHDKGQLEQMKQFVDAKRATAAYEAAEAEYRGNDRFEIVLVASDSIATIERTHGHYFKISDEAIFSEFLPQS